MRGAAKVIIVLPDVKARECPSLENFFVDNKESDAVKQDQMDPKAGRRLQTLKEWGSRMWTFPEVILGPEEPIDICWKRGSVINWFQLVKRDFPTCVWEDSITSMQMIENYNTTSLTRIEFTKIALECLTNRKPEDEYWYYPGDMAYVLMGFLRIRPRIDKFDSSIQAFARWVTVILPLTNCLVLFLVTDTRIDCLSRPITID